MNSILSPNTQAILLLTSQLSTGKTRDQLPLVTPAIYRRIVRLLFDAGLEPADFLGDRSEEALEECKVVLPRDDAAQILDRGLQLSRAIDYWTTRSIWVTSRADPHYPARLRQQFGAKAPAVVYGIGQMSILDAGGLAIVGSRNVSQEDVKVTSEIAELAAESSTAIISGAARGVDQTAMLSTINAGGRVIGVLADSLAKKSLEKDFRNALMENRLVLITTNDPNTPFRVWSAMDRNKYIYGFADAGLVIATDFGKGGTWAGAVEQLEQLKLVPIYINSDGRLSKGLKALIEKGALKWPKPTDPRGFQKIFEPEDTLSAQSSPKQLQFPL